MARRPCGSAPLKAAIAKAEAAASAVSSSSGSTTGSTGGGGGACGSLAFSELLVVRLQAARRRLEVERVAEALHKAVLAYKAVADLPKLETAVLNARKVGAMLACTCVCAARCAFLTGGVVDVPNV